MSQGFHAVPLREAAKTDSAAREILLKLESGEASVCAPFHVMNRAWTPQEEADFHAALASVFGWNNAEARA